MGIPANPHPCQQLVVSLVSISAIPVRVCLVVTLVCIFLMIKDIEHLFLSLFALFMSPLFKYFTHLNIGLLVSLLSCEIYVPRFSSVQLLSSVRLETPWTVAHQASLSITNSQSLLRLMSIEMVMPSNHLILWVYVLY